MWNVGQGKVECFDYQSRNTQGILIRVLNINPVLDSTMSIREFFLQSEQELTFKYININGSWYHKRTWFSLCFDQVPLEYIKVLISKLNFSW